MKLFLAVTAMVLSLSLYAGEDRTILCSGSLNGSQYSARVSIGFTGNTLEVQKDNQTVAYFQNGVNCGRVEIETLAPTAETPYVLSYIRANDDACTEIKNPWVTKAQLMLNESSPERVGWIMLEPQGISSRTMVLVYCQE